MALHLGGTPRETERHVLHLRGHGLAPQMRLGAEQAQASADYSWQHRGYRLAAQFRLVAQGG